MRRYRLPTPQAEDAASRADDVRLECIVGSLKRHGRSASRSTSTSMSASGSACSDAR